jgi:hypothetical protein
MTDPNSVLCFRVHLLTGWRLSHNQLITPTVEFKIKIEVTLRLAVYRQSVLPGVKPLEIHDKEFFFN